MSDGLPHTVVLDTHVWLWLEFADGRIKGSKALDVIEAARRRGGVIISVISMWEVALLESKSRIALYQDCNLWLRSALAQPGVFLQQLNADIIVDSTRLPGDFHADPADRFLVATARNLKAPLVTADSRILAYAQRQKSLIAIPV